MIRLDRVCKSFGHLKVLRDVSLNIEKGEVVCIIGPSGAGKSTLLRCINHLEGIDSGTIYLEEEPVYRYSKGGKVVVDSERRIEELRSEVGMVFQSFNLFPHLTALENVMLAPVHVRNEPRDEARRRGEALLTKVGLSDKIDAYPHELSGGQQQRVAIARALINEPRLILADEPTGNLDTRTSVEIMAILQRLNRRGITVVLVTHEEDIAQYASRVVVFRDGRLRTDAPVSTPRDAEAILPTLTEEVAA
jgi:ABC-type polar amino acid transport system, ATPase component